GWLEDLAGWLTVPGVGVVGAKLFYPDGTLNHAGIGLSRLDGLPHGLFEKEPAEELGYLFLPHAARNVAAVTGACLLTRTALYRQLHGFDETELPVAYNDVDFCLRVRATGRLVVYTPHAELRHREGASRGRLHHLTDEELFWRRWGREGGIRDPYVNPHLRSLNPLQLRLGPVPTDR
ncbi:MAG: glycosyltransferase family 2 protein, partial [Streptosporangiaceae bacterium]